jgi:nucleoside-diphosphate-sugar epimerase
LSGVLVTGGAGYIGSHAVKALVAEGERVVIYDDLSAGHREAARRAGGGSTPLVEGDIRDTERVRQTIQEHDLDAVMHFAAWRSVGDSVRDPAGYYRNNVLGALSVLQAMVAARARRFVFSSTAKVSPELLDPRDGERFRRTEHRGRKTGLANSGDRDASLPRARGESDDATTSEGRPRREGLELVGP